MKVSVWWAALALLADVVAEDNCFPSRGPLLCSLDLVPSSPLSDSLLCSQQSTSTGVESLIPGNRLKIDVFFPFSCLATQPLRHHYTDAASSAHYVAAANLNPVCNT